MTDQVAQVLDYASKVLIFIIFAVLAVNAYLNRNMPRVGGKIGHAPGDPPARAGPGGIFPGLCACHDDFRSIFQRCKLPQFESIPAPRHGEPTDTDADLSR